MSRANVLVIEPDAGLRHQMRPILEGAGCSVCVVADSDAGLRAIDTFAPSVIFAGGSSGLIRELHHRCPQGIIVATVPAGEAHIAEQAAHDGAYDSIPTPFGDDELTVVLERALERRDLLDSVLNLRAAIDANPGFARIIGRSKNLLHTLTLALRAARTDSVVLITGETGTGKELLAQAIQANSRRKDKPLVTVNCGAIPVDLLESELFGHLRGSFTGAVADKPGRVEAANGGTLFLDEAGELPLPVQVKLLRLVQHGEIEKVGATSPAVVNVRIVAATNRDLRAMVDRGMFREDLYYRLAVIPLELPPLRARAGDIAQLAMHLFERLRERHGRPEMVLPASLMPYFAGYHWPGNVRELENVIERLVVLTASNEIARSDLPEQLQRKPAAAGGLLLDLPADRVSLEAVEKEVIFRALKKFSWNQTHAAQYLNISRRTLIYRMEKYGFKPAKSRASGESA